MVFFTVQNVFKKNCYNESTVGRMRNFQTGPFVEYNFPLPLSPIYCAKCFA